MDTSGDEVKSGDCLELLRKGVVSDVHLTFLDPPFNQGKQYRYFNDERHPEKYWAWLTEIAHLIREATVNGGALYFMQREKNVGWIMKVLQQTGWAFQNLIIWKKFTSAIPSNLRYGKQHQVIVFATKGKRPRVFNKLRIDYPLRPYHKYGRASGLFVTDVWDDIRELTSGYLAGEEALRDRAGNRIHEQQSPVELLLRIVLASSNVGDTVFDPFAGSGTSLVVARQLRRHFVGIEIDPSLVKIIQSRLKVVRKADDVTRYRQYYRFTVGLEKIWPTKDLRDFGSGSTDPPHEPC